jgi:hypothetical protein
LTSLNNPVFFSDHEGRSDLGAHGLALEVFLRSVVLVVGLWHHEPLTIGVDGVREVDHLFPRGRCEHRGRDDVDLVRGQRRHERGELHRLNLHGKAGVLGDLGDEIDHDALNAVGLGVEEGEGHARRRRAHFQHLLRGCRHRTSGDNKGRHRGLDETFESHGTTSWIELRPRVRPKSCGKRRSGLFSPL